MWWQYFLVFIGAFFVDVVPIPFPPAFTVMIFLQIYFHLNIWMVIALGISGSILGRLVLTCYIPFVSGKLFKQDKNEDIQFLGKKMKEKGWKGHLLIFIYSLMPLPTTPLFLAGGMSKLSPFYILPGFIFGKTISDTTAMLLGSYATKNTTDILHGVFSVKSVIGLASGLLLVFCLLFIDWRVLLRQQKFKFTFKIWKRSA